MAAKTHVLKFTALAKYFADMDEIRLIARGENAYESNHVVHSFLRAEVLVVEGKVHASMRDRVYDVEIQLDSNKNIETATCTCPRGQLVCHHMAAVYIHAHHNTSVTSVECKWSARKAKEERQVVTVQEMNPGRTHRTTDRDLNQEEVAALKQALEENETYASTCGFTWLLGGEPKSRRPLLPFVEDILFSSDYMETSNKVQFFLDNMKLSAEKIAEVAKETIRQVENEQWLMCRKQRLTASNFGVVLGAIRRKRYPPSLFKRLAGEYNVDNVKAIKWGREHEKEAIQEFTSVTDEEVNPTGIWFDTCGFLGASPDGLIGDQGIIEVKCPFKFRATSMTSSMKVDKSYIAYIENEELKINKTHEYYHQIQGNLYLTGRQTCQLMLWTPKESVVHLVVKDPEWISNLQLLKEFYLNVYIPHIVGKLSSD